MHHRCVCSISCRANKRDLEFYEKQVEVERYNAIRSFLSGMGLQWGGRSRRALAATGEITDADR